jgi:PPOX class probable F420-dependent enzyme
MPSRREIIQLSESELRDFLRASRTMTIVSNGPKGYPHPMPMWFCVDPDGTVRMTTFRKSQKVRNLRRDPRVALMLESGVEYQELKGVVLYGRAELVEDPDLIRDTLLRASGRDVPDTPEARQGLEAVFARQVPKRICIRVRPERSVSWDHSKLGGAY